MRVSKTFGPAGPSMLACIGLMGLLGAGSSPAPQPQANRHTARASHGKALTHTVTVNRFASRLPANACGRQVGPVNGSPGQLGPNGASTSQTLVAVPIGGGNTAVATGRNAAAEACAQPRR